MIDKIRGRYVVFERSCFSLFSLIHKRGKAYILDRERERDGDIYIYISISPFARMPVNKQASQQSSSFFLFKALSNTHDA